MKVWQYGIVVVFLQHQNPQASQRCSNRGSFYFYTLQKVKCKPIEFEGFDHKPNNEQDMAKIVVKDTEVSVNTSKG